MDSTIQVRETVLPPGKYVMKLYDSPAQRHVVHIFNEDQSHLIDTVMAIPTQRMEPTGDTTFTFWETPAGHARALRAWYYPGDTIGNEFPYPKNPRLLAMATVTETTTTPTAKAEAELTQPEEYNKTDNNENVEAKPDNAAVAETPVTEEVKPVEERPIEETPVVTEQDGANNAAETPAPAPAASSSSSELPKTGSPYPLIGLAGALMLALAGLLRFARTA